MIGSVTFHHVAELLMGRMDLAMAENDIRMAAACALMAADAEYRAFQSIPRDRTRTRQTIIESQLSLVDKAMELAARLTETVAL